MLSEISTTKFRDNIRCVKLVSQLEEHIKNLKNELELQILEQDSIKLFRRIQNNIAETVKINHYFSDIEVLLKCENSGQLVFQTSEIFSLWMPKIQNTYLLLRLDKYKQAVKRFKEVSDNYSKLEINFFQLKDCLSTTINSDLDSVENLVQKNTLFVKHFVFGFIIFSLVASILIIRSITKPLREIVSFSEEIGRGNLTSDYLLTTSNDEIAYLAESLNRMKISLRTANREAKARDWVKTGQNLMFKELRGVTNIGNVSRIVVMFLAKYLNCQAAAIYVANSNRTLYLSANYAFSAANNQPTEIKFGEGLVGQVAEKQRPMYLSNIPKNSIKIFSAIGEAIPRNIFIYPFVFKQKVAGIIEMAKFSAFNEEEIELLNNISETIAITIENSKTKTNEI